MSSRLAAATKKVRCSPLASRPFLMTILDDDIGRTCQYKDIDAWRNAARLYCWMFSTPLTVPGGNSGSNVYQLKISNVPDGYGGQQIFWGNYKVNGGTHRITFDECMKYQEGNYCDGFGGWTDTDFGTVSA